MTKEQGNCDDLLDGSQENMKDSQKNKEEIKNKKNTAKAVCILSVFLAVIGSVILFIAFVLSVCHLINENAPPDIIIIISLIVAEEIIVCLVRKRVLQNVARYSCVFTTCANVTSYFLCWLLIGIMMNPTWGLTVTLLVFFTFAAIGFAVYEYYNEISKDAKHKPQSLFSCVCLVSAAIFLVVIVVLAGQSYNGRETADESLKTALLSVIGVLVSWVSWKRHIHATHEQTKLPSSDTPPTSNTVEMHTLPNT